MHLIFIRTESKINNDSFTLVLAILCYQKYWSIYMQSMHLGIDNTRCWASKNGIGLRLAHVIELGCNRIIM